MSSKYEKLMHTVKKIMINKNRKKIQIHLKIWNGREMVKREEKTSTEQGKRTV